MEVKLSEIKVTPLIDTLRRDKIDDNEYFGESYKDYVSNSRLSLINPLQDGSIAKYKAGFKGNTDYFRDGDIIHRCVLQDYYIVNNVDKPSAKLGLVIDAIWDFRLKGLSVKESIVEACKKVDYYTDSLTDKRIKSIISSGITYYKNLKSIIDEKAIFLSDKDVICKHCVDKLNSDRKVNSLLHPKDLFDDEIPSYNEDAFFMDFLVEWNDKKHILKFKLKIDNWSVNEENKIVVLNDLKTTRLSMNQFFDYALNKYHYHRQLAIYNWILLEYCRQQYFYNEEWLNQVNIIAIEKKSPFDIGIFRINDNLLENGIKEFYNLMRMVGYCEITEYSNDVVFV